MVNLGSVLFASSMAASLLAIVATSWGLYRKDNRYLLLGRQSAYLTFILLLATSLTLLYLMVTPDMSVVYVVSHVNHSLPLFYKMAAFWGGQAGSLLFWNLLLSLFTVIAIRDLQKREPALQPGVIIILMFNIFFLVCLGNFSRDSDPFIQYTRNGLPWVQPDGRGLNPLLQHWAMVIHPPILFMGYVSFAVPFAIAISTLLNKHINFNWMRLVRRWTIFSWTFLFAGMLLGGKWAYEELGWGGYWGWDPVENAALMPWIAATAFIHSIIVQEKRGMLKVWNMVLVSLSYLLCIFGTFLTRSGVISSVHAFASSNLGPFFIAYISIIAFICIFLIVKRLPMLRSDNPINSLLSREAGFLYNNIILLIALFAVFWGTTYPAITEMLTSERLTLSAIWFNRWMVPIGLLILFLTGAGPLLAWRKTSGKTIVKNFMWPTISLVTVFIAYTLFRYQTKGSLSLENWLPVAGLSFSLSAFVITGVTEEVFKTVKARKSFTGENYITAFLLASLRYKRRYLGYAVHFGLAILFIGFTGSAFTTESKITLGVKEAERVGDYLIEVADVDRMQTKEMHNNVPLYTTERVKLNIYRDREFKGSSVTEIRTYPMYSIQSREYDDTQTTSEPGILVRPFEDVYVQLGGNSEDGRRVVLQVWINPLVSFVWLGFALFMLPALLLLIPIGEGSEIKIFQYRFSVNPQARIA